MNRKAPKSLLLLLLFFMFAAALAVVAAHFVLSGLNRGMLAELEQSMSLRAGEAASMITARFGNLKGQAESFAGRSTIYLFALEAGDSGISADRLLELAHLDYSEDSLGAIRAESASQAETDLALRMPVLLSEFSEFTQKSGFSGAAMLGKDLVPYFDFAPTPEMLPDLSGTDFHVPASVFDTGLPFYLPLRLSNGELVRDMLFPVFDHSPDLAPADGNFDSGKERVIALLALRLVATEGLRLLESAHSGLYRAGEIQENNGVLQLIDPDADNRLTDLPGWKLEDGRLPLAARVLPQEHGSAYVLALPVPDLPLLVYEAADAAPFEAGQSAVARTVRVASILAAILLALFPWILLQRGRARRERRAAEEQRRLYQVTEQQRQILDGVNSALSAGIALNDLDGVIYYANPDFARLAGLEPQALSGLSYRKLPGPLARSLGLLTQAAFAAKGRVTAACLLPAQDRERRFMATCTPFWDEDNEMTGVVSIYNDVTELDEAHEQARLLAWKCVEVFARAMEAVDPYLSGRSALLAELAPPLAAALGEENETGKDKEDRASTLRIAARLSRVGMLRLFSSSPRGGLLDESSREELRRHVDYAREALEGIDFGLPVLEAVMGMYERADGSGYPAGLKGKEVNLNARILGAVDSFCAMIRPRSYRAAYTPQQALDFLAASPCYDQSIVAGLSNFLHTQPGLKILADSLKTLRGQA